MPNYCYNLKHDDTFTALDPKPLDWAVDIELTWNAIVDYDMGKITESHVVDTPSTTDLLCSPGKYTDTEYKVDSIYKSFGTTWFGDSNLAPEFVGYLLNGSPIAQALTTGSNP